MVRAINTNETSSGPRSEFTPLQATEMLPLVRRIVEDLIELQASIDAQREQLKGINWDEVMEEGAYQDELRDVRSSLNADELQSLAYLEELAMLGVVVHDPFDGSVDFPAVWNRRKIRLCWKPEDKKVEYWHELGGSDRDRKKIDNATDFQSAS